MSENNIYYHPEKHGLEIVCQIDFDESGYGFDYRVIWKDSAGKLYTARDSGCSCPVPFEDIASIHDLEDYDFETVRNEALTEGQKENYEGDNIHDFIAKLPKK